MNARAKRAFSALATVAVVAVTVFGIIGLTAVPVSAEDRIELSGPTDGHVGETLTYSVLVTRSGTLLEPTRIPASGKGVRFSFIIIPEGVFASHSVYTDPEGLASTSFTFTEPGSYAVQARETLAPSVASQYVYVAITEATPTPTVATPTPTDGGGPPTGGDSGQAPVVGDATSTKTTNTSVAGIADIASQAEAATGLGSNALLILFGIAIVVLLAVIAAVLLMRRRRDDEYEQEGPYRRERRYRR